MRSIFLTIVFMTNMLLPTLSKAEVMGMSYELYGQATTTKLPNGTWDGYASFQNVYCTNFPTPEYAISLHQAYFNNKSVFLASVVYPDNRIASIVVSTIPEYQNEGLATELILGSERDNEAALAKDGIAYKVSTSAGMFGRSINVVASNSALRSKNGPFPLARSFIKSPIPTQPIVSKSVHRLFVRGHNRFEIAVIQMSPQATTNEWANIVEPQLTEMLNALTSNLEACTLTQLIP
ncbi:MAG: hypothetical protein PHP05_02195 [Sideroxydans sp.]|nr:hypothetical protein [Sideroxydans sp.]